MMSVWRWKEGGGYPLAVSGEGSISTNQSVEGIQLALGEGGHSSREVSLSTNPLKVRSICRPLPESAVGRIRLREWTDMIPQLRSLDNEY